MHPERFTTTVAVLLFTIGKPLRSRDEEDYAEIDRQLFLVCIPDAEGLPDIPRVL